jgi:thymidylate synthase (FAD)
MKIIEPSTEILSREFNIFAPNIDNESLKRIERIARVCYKSEDSITEDSSRKLIASLIANGHEAMIEHSMLSVLFIVDRGISHELVRHRMASFAQESTRYCNYAKEKFGRELTFIKPAFLEEDYKAYDLWHEAMEQAEKSYLAMIDLGLAPGLARSVLPNSLKTEIVITANFREWRHIFTLRTSHNAHLQMRQVMIPLYHQVKKRIPIIFDGISKD